MAKFSVFRNGEEYDDDDEYEGNVPSAPEAPELEHASKRRRIFAGSAATFSSPRWSEEASVAPSGSNPVSLPEDEGSGYGEEVRREEGREVVDGGGAEWESSNSMNRSNYVVLSDPDVLDCPICFDPLTIPVYQCENGHIACSSCCINCKNDCPSCFEKIGYNRCRAVENVLESVKIMCFYKSYGCRAKVSYCDKLSHEETCFYAPYPCPFRDCIFRGSLSILSLHLGQKHRDSFLKFRFNSLHACSFGITEKFLILQEEGSGALFVLNVWDKMAVKLITPRFSPLENRFAYALIVRGGGSSLRFQSFTERATGLVIDDPPSKNFCLVPEHFFNSSGCLKLELCIWSNKDCLYADISEGIAHVGETDNGS